MHKTCGYLGERGGPKCPPRIPSGSQGRNWGRGRGEAPSLGPAAGRQGGARLWESETVPRGGECCSRSPCCILISAAAAQPRGRPSIFHTKGRPPGPPQSPPHCPPPITAGPCKAAAKGVDRHTGRDRKTQEIQAKTHRVGPEGRVRHSALEMTRDTSEQRRSEWRRGDREEAEPGAGERKDKGQRAEGRHKGRDTQRPEKAEADRDSDGSQSGSGENRKTTSPEPKTEQPGAWLRGD